MRGLIILDARALSALNCGCYAPGLLLSVDFRGYLPVCRRASWLLSSKRIEKLFSFIMVVSLGAALLFMPSSWRPRSCQCPQFGSVHALRLPLAVKALLRACSMSWHCGRPSMGSAGRLVWTRKVSSLTCASSSRGFWRSAVVREACLLVLGVLDGEQQRLTHFESPHDLRIRIRSSHDRRSHRALADACVRLCPLAYGRSLRTPRNHPLLCS